MRKEEAETIRFSDLSECRIVSFKILGGDTNQAEMIKAYFLMEVFTLEQRPEPRFCKSKVKSHEITE